MVWAPPADKKLAQDAATTIRGKNFFGYYESKLNIAHLGFGNQAASGRFEIFLDPELRSALTNADGITAKRCENPAREAIDIYAGIGDDEVFHAALAHELFHAAQSQLAGDFDDNWWFEATATWADDALWLFVPCPRGLQLEGDRSPGPADGFLLAGRRRRRRPRVWGVDVRRLVVQPPQDRLAQLRQIFVASAHSDATPVLTSRLSQSGDTLGDEVASYWADHTNVNPQFGPDGQDDRGHGGRGHEQQ